MVDLSKTEDFSPETSGSEPVNLGTNSRSTNGRKLTVDADGD